MTYLQQFPLPSTSCLSRKIIRHTKRQNRKNQFEEIEQASDQDSDMAGILELSDWEFKTTMVTILRPLMDVVEFMQEKMDIVSRELEILRKNKVDMPELETQQEK